MHLEKFFPIPQPSYSFFLRHLLPLTKPFRAKGCPARLLPKQTFPAKSDHAYVGRRGGLGSGERLTTQFTMKQNEKTILAPIFTPAVEPDVHQNGCATATEAH